MDDIGKLEGIMYAVLGFLVVGFIAYALYEYEQGGDGTDPTKPTVATSVVNNLGIGTSSETYSDAAQQTASSPFTTLGTITGGWWNDLTGN
jgi:hypothetical protein